MRRNRAHRSSGWLRSLKLPGTFVVASAAILAIGAFALSSTLASGLRREALEDNARYVQTYVDAVLAPSVVRGDRLVVTPRIRRQLTRTVRLPDVRAVSIWSRDGRLLASTAQPGQVGTRPARPALRDTARTRQASAEVVDSAARGSSPALEVWTPLLSSNGRAVGAAEVVLDARVVIDSAARSSRTIWLAVGVVFGIVWLGLAVLVLGASVWMRVRNKDLETRSRELADSRRHLERTLLETIETLNAAVEARDPYTAGHSQRVRRVALAVGRELKLDADRLDALGTAALFHDIGKIGMPDSILTKPELLTRAEAAVMREHVTRGAEIVARISSFQASMPAIRYHHERWDGLGYPDGRSGEDIPLEAAIIGLADAWDAMTTDRPYATALDLNGALMQVRAGRGKQFSPAVVDAFWAVARARPADILPPEEPTAAVAVV